MQSFYFTLLPFRCVHLWKIPHIFAICKNGRSKFFLPIFEMTAAQPVIIAVLSVCSSAPIYPFLPFPNISWESKQTACLLSASAMRTTDCETIHFCTGMLLRTLMYPEVVKRK